MKFKLTNITSLCFELHKNHNKETVSKYKKHILKTINLPILDKIRQTLRLIKSICYNLK